MNKGYIVLKRDYEKMVTAYYELQQENQRLRNHLKTVKNESSAAGAEIQHPERISGELVVRISCGNEQSTALLTPHEVKVLKQKLHDIQEAGPDAGWTTADIIACAVIWRGVEVIEKELEDEL